MSSADLLGHKLIQEETVTATGGILLPVKFSLYKSGIRRSLVFESTASVNVSGTSSPSWAFVIPSEHLPYGAVALGAGMTSGSASVVSGTAWLKILGTSNTVLVGDLVVGTDGIRLYSRIQSGVGTAKETIAGAGLDAAHDGQPASIVKQIVYWDVY